MNDIDVIVLCGGKGTRLRSVVSDKPKSLAPVDASGTPFLDLLIEQLESCGVRRIVLAVGYLADQIRARYQHKPHVVFAEEKEPLGTGGAIRFAAQETTTETIMIMPGDSFVDGTISLGEFVSSHRRNNADVSLMVARPRAEKDYGVVTFDHDGRITGFNEKPSGGGGGGGGDDYLNAGLYLFEKRAIDAMSEPGTVFSIEMDYFPSICGRSFFAHRVDLPVVDIGTPERFARAQGKRFVLEK